MKSLAVLFVVLFQFNALADEPGVFDFQIRKDKQRSSVWWHPLSSFAVPGLAQYLNGQTEAGLTYSIAGGIGLGVGIANWPTDVNKTSLQYELDDRGKAFVWGLQTYQAAGSLSTYHAFRSVVKQRQEKGFFEFLKVEETPDQLMKAPFKIGYFLEPKALIPLSILGAGLIYAHNNGSHLNGKLTGSDALFTSGVSYNAGVGEEAIFRGYLMMNLRENWGSDFWSNAATSVVFSAAHLSEENKYPWPQLVLGFYLGWMTQKNDWTLSESIFLHTWWDIIAIGAALSEDPSAIVFLPLLSHSF